MQEDNNILQEARTSDLDKLIQCYNDNTMLMQQENMSLFTQEALSMFSDIVNACKGNRAQLVELLDDEDNEFFTDQQAKELVNWRVFGKRFNGDNIYAEKLAQINKPKVAQSVGAKNAQAKKDREAAAFKEIEKGQGQSAFGGFVQPDLDDITPEDAERIRSMLDRILPSQSGAKLYAFKDCSVYLPINSKAKMSQGNTGIVYGDSPAAVTCKEKVGKVVRAINSLGYKCTIPRITQVQKRDGKTQNLAVFNVNKKVNIQETYMKNNTMNYNQLTNLISESIKKVLMESGDETDKLFDFLVNNRIATESEVKLVANINGYKPETMLDILRAKTGYRNPVQYMQGECPDGECKYEGGEGTQLDEGFKKAFDKFKNKVKKVGKVVSDYADKEWEDEPVKKKSGESIWGTNTPDK